jgi:hypothetical protein
LATAETQITLKMFIRMTTLMGTPISHKRTLRISETPESLFADKLGQQTRVPAAAS